MTDDVAALQRAMTRVCFDRAPSPEDVAALGGEPILLYRELVRSRIRDLVSIALPRTERTLGKKTISALVDGLLAEAPPRSRYFREVIPAFVAHALPRLRAPGAEPAHAADVLALESTRWELGWRDGAVAGPVVPFELERVPVVHPTLRLLALEHAVHRADTRVGEAAGDEAPERGTFWVCVHRRPDHLVETRTLDATSARLVRAWSRVDRTAIDGVREVLREERREADPAFVERMGTLLSGLLERGALLGSRG